MTNEASTLLDSDASNKAADADAALQELGADDVGKAYVTATVTVWDTDPGIAAEKLRLVEKVIQGRDFTCIAEGVNAIEAWMGSLPGHVYANVRQPPISTLNLAHMIPLSAVWAGPERDEHFDAPPLFFAKTEGSTPFRFSLHVGDVGHTLIVGPTGAGKSVLLALIAMQFRRYQSGQVFAFDFGRSEEHTSELQSLMRISYAVFCLTKKNHATSAESLCLTLHPTTNRPTQNLRESHGIP